MHMVEPSPSLSSGDARDRRDLEEMYSRFAWKWAVLAHTAGRVLTQGGQLPSDFLRDLKCARTMMESGCHSLCEVAAGFRDLEIKLLPALLRVSEGEAHCMRELVGKAMNGTIRQDDMDLSPLKPVLVDCGVPKICFR